MAKFFRKSKTYSQLNPISGKQYCVFFLKTHIPLGVSALLLVFLHNYLVETDIGFQTLFLFFSSVSFIIIGTILGRHSAQCTLARLKSIDPEFSGGLLYSIFLYGALPFTFTTLFLILKKPNSMVGRLKQSMWTLLKFYMGMFLSILLVVTVFVDRNETRAKIGTNFAYYFSGPATFYLLHFLVEISQADKFKNKYRDLSFDKLFPKLKEKCQQQTASTVFYQIVGAAALLKTKRGDGFNQDELLELNKHLIKLASECSPTKSSLDLYNPLWAFSEITLAEGAAMLFVERIIKNLTILIFWPDRLPLDRKEILSEFQKKKIEKMKKASPAYRRANQLKRYPLLNWVHKLLN